MGLLDDAIREHLDLKRRRGADPTEIERAEREALGPVRRSPEPAGDDVAVADAPLDHEAPLPHAPEEEWEPFHEDAGHELEPELEDHELPPYEPEPTEHHEPAEPPAARPFDAEGDPLPPPHPADVSPAPEAEPGLAPHPDDPPPAVPSHLEQETEEYDLEEEEESDDVLESTPEFLQDAPDHDRLWFEQRPPRDFDFDG